MEKKLLMRVRRGFGVVVSSMERVTRTINASDEKTDDRQALVDLLDDLTADIEVVISRLQDDLLSKN
jgi:hypothetical protein